MALDIGPKSITLFEAEISDARTIIWNGPMGVFEMPAFAKGTHAIAHCVAGNHDAITIVGGGDSVAAVKQLLDLLSKSGMSPVEVTAPHEWDVGPAVRNLIGRVDLVYTIFDDKVAAQYQVVAQTCDQAHIPLFTADPRQVRLGAMASLGLPGTVKQVEPAAGRAALHRPARPERTIAGAWLYLNLDAAARQGVTMPDDVLKSAVLVSQARAANTEQTKNGPRKADGAKP